MTLCVAILLGGKSSRMGEPKHLIKMGESQTLMDVMISFASTLSERIVTAGGQYSSLPSVSDRRHDAGPLAGVEALLHSGMSQRYLMLGCDMPNLNSQSIQQLIDATHSASFVREGRVYGLPCVIDSTYADVCTTCLDGGMRSLKEFLTEIDAERIPATSEIAESFSSLNTPSDVYNFALKRGRA